VWWLCNSTNSAPEKLSTSGLAAHLAELVGGGWTIFMVKGDKWPPPTQRSSGLAPADKWVDPANPPSDGSGFGNARRPEEPKFQAFTGSGQRLGGGGGASSVGDGSGGAGGAADSEEAQLAMALNLSAGLAVKARLEARLRPEPEAGASAARVLVRMPDGGRISRRFAADEPLTALLDFVAIQLADASVGSAGNWQLVSQYPPIKLPFAADASPLADAVELATQTFAAAGLAPSAQLHLSPY
jgi:hypothetical protein